MYIPHSFREDRLDVAHKLIRDFPFAPMVTMIDGLPFATHLPFLLDSTRGKFGTLRAHMARPNPQWRGFDSGSEALTIFQGPHAYISPSWYSVQPAVPTWNYAVVHAYGIPSCIDEDVLRTILLDTVAAFESPGGSLPLPGDFFDKMSLGVVGFEIEITRLEGKFKLSQNRSDEDRLSVIQALAKSEHANERETAAWMQAAMASK